MAERLAYRLVARSPFHFGERGVGIEEASLILHADTLFSAVCLALRELGEPLEPILERFPRVRVPGSGPPRALAGEDPPPFRFSSAFPFGGQVHLFPRPLLRAVGLDEIEDPGLGKALKKVRYVSQPVFEALAGGQSVASYLLGENGGSDEMRADVLLQGGRAWVSPSELASLRGLADARTGAIRLWDEGTVPRVTVDRVSSRSQVYAAGRVTFASECGLFFLADYADAALQPKVEQALRALGDTGIGGERSSGHGQFRLEIVESFPLAEPPDAETGAYTTLAPYWPPLAEVQAGVLDDASYGLLNRRGWLASPEGMNLRRRGVRMLMEGSVTRARPTGALADVKPLDPAPAENVAHDVWRYGLAYPLRCRVAPAEGGGR
jgi:CRISPR-associated protein Csm4